MNLNQQTIHRSEDNSKLVKTVKPSKKQVTVEKDEDDGTYQEIKVPVSSTHEDRDGDRFTEEGLADMVEQLQSGDVPLFLDHGLSPQTMFPDYRALEQRGFWKNAEVKEEGDHKVVYATAQLDTEDEKAQEIGRKIDDGMPIGFSVGFRVLNHEGDIEEGMEFMETDLLETSAVGIPSNPSGVAQAAGQAAAAVKDALKGREDREVNPKAIEKGIKTALKEDNNDNKEDGDEEFLEFEDFDWEAFEEAADEYELDLGEAETVRELFEDKDISESEVDQCISEKIDEGMDQEQAVAACLSMLEEGSFEPEEQDSEDDKEEGNEPEETDDEKPETVLSDKDYENIAGELRTALSDYELAKEVTGQFKLSSDEMEEVMGVVGGAAQGAQQDIIDGIEAEIDLEEEKMEDVGGIIESVLSDMIDQVEEELEQMEEDDEPEEEEENDDDEDDGDDMPEDDDDEEEDSADPDDKTSGKGNDPSTITDLNEGGEDDDEEKSEEDLKFQREKNVDYWNGDPTQTG